MAKGIFLKMARTNLSRNKQLYLPYAVAVSAISGMFFMILNTVLSKSISNMTFGQTTIAMLLIGCFIMAIFTFGFMLYLNSFLIKRRKKEFGLYGVLGLEKKHIGRIVFLENTILNLSSLAVGLIGGTVLGRLAFWLLLRLINVAPGSEFKLSPMAYIATILFFLAIFAVDTIYNQIKVRTANPIDLLHGDNKGEKKLRGTGFLAVLGVISLGLGYTASITCKLPYMALFLFWPAVLAVVIGTFLLFLAGSQAVLSAIKKSRAYYKPRNFISVSTLAHRLRQNSAGLSNICLLSTMVLVTVSFVCTLFFGVEDIISERNFPYDAMLTVQTDYEADGSREFDIQPGIDSVIAYGEENGVTVDSYLYYNFYTPGTYIYHQDKQLLEIDDIVEGRVVIYNSRIGLIEDYNRLTGQNLSLEEDELVIVFGGELEAMETITLGGETYRVAGIVNDFAIGGVDYNSLRFVFLLFRDEQAALNLAQQYSSYDMPRACKTIEFTLSGTQQAKADFGLGFVSAFVDGLPGEYTVRDAESVAQLRQNLYSVYGGLMFIGIFFTMLFLTVAILVMYFKQLSEGYDDRERYAIMRKVGLGEDEIHRTINRQIMIVFFLPLAVALIHILAAVNIMALMMGSLSATTVNLVSTIKFALITSAVYAAVYFVVYRLTARTYYKIIK